MKLYSSYDLPVNQRLYLHFSFVQISRSVCRLSHVGCEGIYQRRQDKQGRVKVKVKEGSLVMKLTTCLDDYDDVMLLFLSVSPKIIKIYSLEQRCSESTGFSMN